MADFESQTQDEQNVNIVFNQTVDQFLENLPITSVRRSLANNLYGIDYTRTPKYLPISKNTYGYTFFTRPQLNLSLYNISNYTPFYSLLTTEPTSIQRYVRLMLDPRLSFIGKDSPGIGYNAITGAEPDLYCPLLDVENPFIPILSNNLTDLSGWPDITLPVYTSPSGLYSQEYSLVDGVTNNYEAFDVDVTFRNTRGEPIIYMMYIWIKYMNLVFEGILNPYFDFITENELDYNTRIYRLVMDSTNTKVVNIAHTGASFPLNVPTGNLFDVNSDTPYNTKNSQISIRFKSNGFIAFEDLAKYEFNEVITIFNSSFKKLLENDTSTSTNLDELKRDDPTAIYQFNDLVKIPKSIMINPTIDNGILTNKYFSLNYRAMPWINLYTNELEWWVKQDLVGNISEQFNTNPFIIRE